MNRTSNDITLVCYDVTSNKLRRKIDKTMKDFGVRLQYSIFLCQICADDVNRCREKLMKILKRFSNLRSESDSIIFIGRLGVGQVDCLLGDKWMNQNMDFEIF